MDLIRVPERQNSYFAICRLAWNSLRPSGSRESRLTGRIPIVSKAGILVLASHSRQLILDNCEKGLWLDGGTIRAFGPIRKVRDAYEADNIPSPAIAGAPTTATG